MREIADKLKQNGVKKIIFTGPSPHWRHNLPLVVVSKLWDQTPKRSFVDLDNSIFILNKKIKKSFLTSDSEFYISLTDYFCNSDGCQIYFGNDRKGGIASWDNGHLTLIASERFSRDILAPFIIKISD